MVHTTTGGVDDPLDAPPEAAAACQKSTWITSKKSKKSALMHTEDGKTGGARAEGRVDGVVGKGTCTV